MTTDTQYRSELMRALSARGYVHDLTHPGELDTRADDGAVVAYCGFDCTAKSLHVGNLVSIMLLRRLQQAGHKPIVLLGGGTTRVGDPSGKDASRQLLTDETIAANIAGIRANFEQFIQFGDGPSDAILVNNADWLDTLEYIPFLRDIGRHFSVNRMLSFDSVKLRLDREQPLSFLEFNYMILQAYDFLELSRRHNCALQVGGSDQWGNIVNGVELIRRVDQNAAFGLTTPLITKSDGSKMGKTADGAIWLSPDLLPSYDYWQFWRNVPDADVGRFLRLYTDVPLDEITRLEALEGHEVNAAKEVLADAATAMCRGDEDAKLAKETALKVFQQGSVGDDLPTAEVAGGTSLIDAFIALGFAKSKGEARRLISQGGARVNGAQVTDIEATLNHGDLDEGGIKLSAGKKRHGVITLI